MEKKKRKPAVWHKCKRCGRLTKNKVYCSIDCRFKKKGRERITPEMEREIIDMTSSGMTQKSIAAYFGMNRKTIIRFTKKHKDFRDKMAKAKYSTDKLAFKSIRVGMVRDWKAGAWWVKKRYPAEFGDKVNVVLDEQPILIDDILNEDEKKQSKNKVNGSNTSKR